jgi:hypothetical protein
MKTCLLVIAVTTLLPLSMPYAAMAACDDDFGKISESFKLNRDEVLDAIKQGCPPPENWRKTPTSQGSGLQGFSGKSYLGNFKKSARAANDPLQYYQGSACNTYDGTRPGGFADLGADNPCIKGNGYGMFSVNQISGAPIANQSSMSCISNLFSAITGIVTGSGGGGTNAASNPNITGGATVSANCVSGSIGVCGLGSIGGQICNNGTAKAGGGAGGGQPFSVAIPPQYIQISNVVVFDYDYNSVNANSAVFVPNGGVMTFNSRSYTIPRGGFVTMSPTGMIYIGRRGGGYINLGGGFLGNQGIQLGGAAGNTVSITPTGGIVQPNASIVTGSTVGSAMNVQTANTVVSQNTPANQSAQTSVTNTPSAGPTSSPPPGRIPTGTPFTGSFPPLAVSTPNPPPNPNISANIVPQQAISFAP